MTKWGTPSLAAIKDAAVDAVKNRFSEVQPTRLSDAALKAASVSAVEAEALVEPTGQWDFDKAPTVNGTALGSGGGSPPTTDASQLTSGTLPAARIGDSSIALGKLAFDPATQAELDAVAAATQAVSLGQTSVPGWGTAWSGNTAYIVGDVRLLDGLLQRCIIAHTSNNAGLRYDREKWEALSLSTLHGATSVPISEVDQTNIGAGLTNTPRAGLFQRPQRQFNYLAERMMWAFRTTSDVTASGTSVTAANGTAPGGSVVLTRASGTNAMRATSQVLTTPVDLSGNTQHIRVPVKITTATASAYLNIYLSSAGANFTNCLKRTVIAADPPPFGWRTYSIPLSEMTVQGTGADATAINCIQIEYDSGAAGDKMEVSRVTRHPNVVAKPKLALWFDDGNLTNQAAAIDIATSRGLPVTLAHIADTFTAAGTSITADKARYLQDYSGAQVAVHAFGAVDHNRAQDARPLLEQMLDYQHFGLALGLKGIEDAAYYNPGFAGVTSAEMELVARKLFRSARATGAAFPETLPPGDPLRTRAFMPPTNSTFSGYYQPLINRTIVFKGFLQIVWHAMNATDLTEWTTLCDWLDANRATIDVVTPMRAFDPLCM